MELFKKRPLALCCFCAVVIMVSGLCMNKLMRRLSMFLLSAAFIISLVFLTVLYIKKTNKARAKNLICLLICIVLSMTLLLGIHSFVSKNETVDILYGKNVHITGTVDGVRYKTFDESAFNVTLTSLDGKKCNIGAILKIASSSKLDDYDKFSLVSTISRPDNEEYYLISEGLNAKIECSSEKEISYAKVSNKKTLANFFKDINSSLQDLINDKTDEKTGALMGALLLGNRDNLRAEVIRDFRRCGISHMLALSGLHMAIIIGAFDWILKSCFVNKKIRCVILIFASIFYLAITGFSSSASRAVIMLCIVYVSYLMNGDAESITSLFIALVLILAISPFALFDIGLWLSFFATLGIIVVSDSISAIKFRIKKKPFAIRIIISLLTSVAITLAAIFSVCAFSWLFFGEISIISPIANLIFSPMMTLILILGIVLIFSSPIPMISGVVAKAVIFSCECFERFASNISYQRGIVISLKYDFVPYIIIPLCVSLIVFLVIKIKHKWTIAITPTLAVVAFIISLTAFNNAYINEGNVIYLKSKRNEALILSTISEISVCDISSGGYHDLSSACAAATDGIAVEIENLILTHYHKYHVASVQRVCNKYMIRNVYLPEPENEDEIKVFSDLVQALGNMKVNRIIYERGHLIDAENGYFISVSTTEYISRSTHPVFAVSVSSETTKLIYGSSAFPEAEKFVSLADVLILGSHGATIKPFSAEHLQIAPPTMVFSAPDEMLKNKDFVSYLNLLYQNGHEVVLDTTGRYEFNMAKQTD